jgi:hypothetical protein
VPRRTQLLQSFLQNIDSGIPISILNVTTFGTNMSSLRKSFFDHFTTIGATLSGVVGSHRNCDDPKDFPEILQPSAKLTPGGIIDGLGQMPILDHIANLEVFKRHQVYRLDYAPRFLTGEVFTLALYLQMRSPQPVDGFFPVGRTLLFTGYATIRFLKSLLRYSQMTWIFYCIAITVGVEVFQPDIQTEGFSSWLALFKSLYIQNKLAVVSITTSNQSDSFDLLKLVEMQLTGSPEFKSPSTKAIGKSDIASIF